MFPTTAQSLQGQSDWDAGMLARSKPFHWRYTWVRLIEVISTIVATALHLGVPLMTADKRLAHIPGLQIIADILS